MGYLQNQNAYIYQGDQKVLGLT